MKTVTSLHLTIAINVVANKAALSSLAGMD